MRGLAAIPPPAVEQYQRELRANNVPPGQEGQFFMSRGRPLDPNLLFLIQQNQIQDTQQPRQAPVMSSVLQDTIAAAMQQAQAQPLPPPAAMQQAQGLGMPPMMAAQGTQREAGIAPLPFNNQGYARGGIVAFAGDDEETGQLVEGNDEDTKKQDALSADVPDVKTAQDLLALARANAARNYTEELKAAYAPVRKMDEQERLRREAVAKELGEQERKAKQRAVWGALSEMGGHRTAALGLKAAGQYLGEEIPKVEQLYRTAKEQAAQGNYQMQRADKLLEAGFVKEGTTLRNTALKQLTDAEKTLAAAKRAEAQGPKLPTTPGAMWQKNWDEANAALEAAAPGSDEEKKAKAKLARLEKDYKARPGLYAPQPTSAGIAAAAKRYVADVTTTAKKDVEQLKALLKDKEIDAGTAIKRMEIKRKTLADRLGPELTLRRRDPETPEEARLLADYEYYMQEIDNLGGDTSAASAAPATAPGARPPLSSFNR